MASRRERLGEIEKNFEGPCDSSFRLSAGFDLATNSVTTHSCCILEAIQTQPPSVTRQGHRKQRQKYGTFNVGTCPETLERRILEEYGLDIPMKSCNVSVNDENEP